MLIVGPQDKVDESLRGGVLAIGNFDGLHRGHQQLLALAREEAQRRHRPLVLVTFEPHPRSFFQPDNPVFRLTPLPLKARIAKSLGVDAVAWFAFDAALAATPPENFVTHLATRFGPACVFTGYDFHFGKGRKGSPDSLREWGGTHGFDVVTVDQVTDDDGQMPFSSSSIRSALRRGQVRQAAHELGYDWTVMGEVVHGDKRGRTIGFPTANIVLEPGAEPFRGIYAVLASDDAAPDAPAWQGAAYFGDRPTFNTKRTFLEVFLLDQTLDLYGRTLRVSFVDLVRPDQTFASIEALVQQMQQDCAAVRRILATHAGTFTPGGQPGARALPGPEPR